MSPMPDFPDSVEQIEVEEDLNLNTDDASHVYDRKISVREAEKSNLSVYEGRESRSSDTINSDKSRTEKTTLMRENSVDTLASKWSNQAISS